MLRDSGLLTELGNHAFSPTGEPMCLYGDPAYPLRVHLQAPFRDARLTPDMEAFNSSMSKVRVSVEWIFGDVVKSFKFMDFKNNLKIGLSTVGKNVHSLCTNQKCHYLHVWEPDIRFLWVATPYSK